MTPRIKNKSRMRELPWPIDIPELKGSKLCPYTEPKAGKSTLWEHVNRAFDPATSTGDEMQTQFLYILLDVINESVDQHDAGKLGLCDLPSPSHRHSKAPYSCDEVAAWWNEAVTRLRSML